MPKIIPLFKVRMCPEATCRVGDVLKSGYIGQGPIVDEFESALGKYLNHPSPVTVNSATSGLTLALRLIKNDLNYPGEVLSQPITCTATNWAILAAGYKIKWVDTDPRNCNMDIPDLRCKISSNTRAIMVVHWGGYPNDLDAIKEVQKECFIKYGNRVEVIEDAAHAFGAEYNGVKIGGHGNYCVFSFQAIKHVTCGDGGALLCSDKAQTDRAKLLRWYGLDRTKSESFRCDQDVVEWGYKFHMNDINAAIGLENLAYIEDTLQRQKDNAAYYRKELYRVKGITLLEELPNRCSANWIFTLRAQGRDNLQKKLCDYGIMCGRVHNRNDKFTCTKEFIEGSLSGTDQMHREMLCIPVGWWLSSEDREYIVKCIKEGW